MIINHYLTEFVLSCVFRNVIYREQQDSPFFLLYSRQNAEKLQFVVNQFCLAKIKKTAQKALGKARKSGAEGESLKVVSYFYYSNHVTVVYLKISANFSFSSSP